MAKENAAETYTASGIHGPFTSKRFSWWVDMASGPGTGTVVLEQQMGNSSNWMTVFSTNQHMPIAETFDTLGFKKVPERTYRFNMTILSGSIRIFVQQEEIE